MKVHVDKKGLKDLLCDTIEIVLIFLSPRDNVVKVFI